MKYILAIVGLSLLSIPFFIWYGLYSIWTFRTDKIKKFGSEIFDTIDYQYRRAFPYKPTKRNRL